MSFDKVMFFYMVLFLVWARSTPNVWICVNKAVLWFASTSWKIFVSLDVGAKKDTFIPLLILSPLLTSLLLHFAFHLESYNVQKALFAME